MYIYMYENRIMFLNFCKIKFEFIIMEINLFFFICFEFFRIIWLEKNIGIFIYIELLKNLISILR